MKSHSWLPNLLNSVHLGPKQSRRCQAVNVEHVRNMWPSVATSFLAKKPPHDFTFSTSFLSITLRPWRRGEGEEGGDAVDWNYLQRQRGWRARTTRRLHLEGPLGRGIGGDGCQIALERRVGGWIWWVEETLSLSGPSIEFLLWICRHYGRFRPFSFESSWFVDMNGGVLGFLVQMGKILFECWKLVEI